jgi:hypothetical protein
MTVADTTPRARPIESSKITDAHRAKLALVYVRQSTPQQVAENRESLARQYALADHARSLGWPTERVLVIDEDLGLSGRTADIRLGFQRLLAEVTMDHVGLVLGLEMSRLSRSCKDWHHILEVCGIFGTLLADQDGIYDPAGNPVSVHHSSRKSGVSSSFLSEKPEIRCQKSRKSGVSSSFLSEKTN